ncbi:hypothetical protein [Bacillus sp. AK031]
MLWEAFDKNEIYILIMLAAAYSAFFILPKKLPTNITALFLVWGFSVSTLFDFTIGGGLIDFYRVNDSNRYEFFDLLSYFLFAAFSYFFVYFYEVFKIRGAGFILYVFGWSVIGMAMEKVSSIMGLTHYQNGYKIYYSLAVFLIIQSATALYYQLVRNLRDLK